MNDNKYLFGLEKKTTGKWIEMRVLFVFVFVVARDLNCKGSEEQFLKQTLIELIKKKVATA